MPLPDLKIQIAQILGESPDAADAHLINIIRDNADAAALLKKNQEAQAAIDAHEKEIKKILTAAPGALRRDQAEQILKDRAASKAKKP